MTKRFSFMAAALISVTAMVPPSCTVEKQEAAVPGGVPVEIEFRLDAGSLTKVTGGDDSSVSGDAGSIKVLVFDKAGRLLGYGENEESSSGITMRLATGEARCYAVVNSKADLSSVASESELLSRVSSLRDNGASSLEMIGSRDMTITASSSVEIPVRRFASKIEIDRISADFKSPAHEAMEFIIKDIYLVNVAGDCTYAMDGTPSVWYNQLKRTTGEADELIADIGINATVTRSSPYATGHLFYCYPNPTEEDSHGSAWSPRYTRLVVDATLGGTLYHYPVNIPKPLPNTLYQITNLTVTGPGSTDPDIPVEKGTITFSITITDWATGFSQEIEY